MARLSIPDQPTSAEFTVTTPTTAFPISFSLFAKADLNVLVDDVDIGQAAFTFSGTVLDGGGYAGGTVTLNDAVDDCTVRIERNVKLERATNFAPSAAVPVGQVDQALNRLTAFAQDQKRRLESAIAAAGDSIGLAGKVSLTALAASAGAGLVGWVQTGTGAVLRTIREKLRENVSVRDFGAIGDGTTDDILAIQKAVDAVNAAGGGTVFFPKGDYLISQALVVPYGVNLAGANPLTSILRKIATTTKAVTIYAGALQGYENGGTLPSDINAIVVLTGEGPIGRYNGSITDLGLLGSLTDPDDSASFTAEFGIVSVGSTSDLTISRCFIAYCKYGVLLPDVFASQITRNRIQQCGYALTLNSATSTPVRGNYANNCAYRGYYFRRCHYMTIDSNGCDYLNYDNLYPVRTSRAVAYDFALCHNIEVVGNGQEYTFGVNWQFDGFDHSTFRNNYSSNLGSDYPGTGEVAWMYFAATPMQGSVFTDNGAYYENNKGLTFGAADPAKHHNFWFENAAAVDRCVFERNNVRTDYSDFTTAAGWGNNSGMPITARNISGSAPIIYTPFVIWDTAAATVTDLILGDPSIREVTIWIRQGTLTFGNYYIDPSVYRFALSPSTDGAVNWTPPAGSFVTLYKHNDGVLWQVKDRYLTELRGQTTVDPASLADGAGATLTVPVGGAAPGDFARASFSNDLQGMTMTAWVSAADTVSVRLQNETGGVLDLASGTLRARVEKA